MGTFSLGDDVIDSRDVIERIEELNAAVADGEIDHAEAEELRQLEELAEEASGYAEDWHYGEALILDSHFEDYAKQLAEDCAPDHETAKLIANDGRGDYWPLTCCTIDWERAVRDLQMDYTSVEVAGFTYWIR